MTSVTPRLLVRIEDAARQLSIGRTTVYKLSGDGQLQLVKIGRRSLVTAESIERFVAALSAIGPRLGESTRRPGSL